MKKGIAIAGLALLGLVAFGAARAQQTDDVGRPLRARFLALHIAHDLSLTGDQRTAIKAILQREKPEIQSLAAQLDQQNAQLRSRTTFDETFVRSVAQQRNATLTEALVEREKIRAEIFAVLTPDQQEKANQISREFRTVVEDRIANLGSGL